MLFAAIVAMSACNSNDEVVPTNTISFNGLELEANSAWYGQDMKGKASDDGMTFNTTFTAGIATFANQYNKAWNGFNDFGYSNKVGTDYESVDLTDNIEKGFTAMNATGEDKYLVLYPNVDASYQPMAGIINFSKNIKINNIIINNNIWAYTSILNGDDVAATKFKEGDWFKVTFTGVDAEGKEIGGQDFYLADYRGGKSKIISDWTTVDLSGFGTIKQLKITFDSSDKNDFGLNTPSYVAIKEITYD